MSRFVLERWDAHLMSWITLAAFETKAEARARAWELRLAQSRVREVAAIAP